MSESPADRPTLGEIAAHAESLGIPCPHCRASSEWSVYYTRPIRGGVRRVRTCRACGRRVVTVERAAGST